MTLDENKELMRTFWIEAWSDKHRHLFIDMMEEGYGADEASFADRVWRGFPDMRITIEEMFAEGDAVISRVVWSGTHEGDYDGIAPTGRVVTMRGLSLYRIRNGRFVRDGQESQFDWLGFNRQLGAIPAE